MTIDGIPSSHLDLTDPLRLDFEYMRWMGDVLDVAYPPEAALAVAHVGAAACTLARYVAASRPGSRQAAFEVEPAVVRACREHLRAREVPGLRLRLAEGRSALGAMREHSLDVVIRDAFLSASVPGHLSTLEFLGVVRRALRPGGLYLANLADRAPLGWARREVATALRAFSEVALVSEPALFSGRSRAGARTGNLVLVASDVPLPLPGLDRRLASGAVRARLLATAEVRRLASGVPALLDEDGGPPAA